MRKDPLGHWWSGYTCVRCGIHSWVEAAMWSCAPGVPTRPASAETAALYRSFTPARLAELRAAFAADRALAVVQAWPTTFCDGRLALIDAILAERQTPKKETPTKK